MMGNFKQRKVKRIIALMLSLIMIVTLVHTSPKMQRVKAASLSLIGDSNVVVDSIELKASYKGDDGVPVNLDIKNPPNVTTFPYNSNIKMELNYIIPKGTVMSTTDSYVYTLPKDVRVDVDTTLQLYDPSGTISIGSVTIDSETGTLTFNFNENANATTGAIPFYVKFEGGLDSSLQKADESKVISFPAQGSTFDFNIKTSDRALGKAQQMTKSGNIYYDSATNKNYIEWTVQIEPGTDDLVSGQIIDNLPAGIEYVKGVGGYPKYDNVKNTPTPIVDNSTTNVVDLTVANAASYYRPQIKFLTTYPFKPGDGNTVGTSTVPVNNTVAFNPVDGKSTTATTTYTANPNVLEKSGSTIDEDGNITWTVIINRDHLDLNGAVFEDTMGTNITLIPSSVNITPAGIVPDTTGGNVKVSFTTSDTNTYTLTYKTKVLDVGIKSQNTAKLTTPSPDPTKYNYNVTRTGEVPGINLVNKTKESFDSVTNSYVWKITVNPEGRTLSGVTTVTENVGPNMEIVSIKDSNGVEISHTAGVMTFTDLAAPKDIYVTTKIKNPETFTTSTQMKNEVTVNWNGKTKTTSAEDWYIYKAPDIVIKEGNYENGEYVWKVIVKKTSNKLTELSFKDTLPTGMEYIPGSMKVAYHSDWTDPNTGSSVQAWHPTYEITPVVTGSTLSYSFDKTKSPNESYMFSGNGNNEFEIVYRTKVSDLSTLQSATNFTNSVDITEKYENGIEVPGHATKTLDNNKDGIIGKSGVYANGNDFVTWTVDINKARVNLSSVTKPAITDQLESYFKYKGGKLYKVAADNSRTEIPASSWSIVIVGNKMTVMLPNLGSDHYQFVFDTQFTVSDDELATTKIKNTVNFVGLGEEINNVSNEIQNVQFHSASGGTTLSKQLKIKKVDANTSSALPDAEFEIYYEGILINSAVSGADGYATFNDIDSLIGKEITIKESVAPSGYLLGTDKNVTVDSSMLTVDDPALKIYEFVFEDTPIPSANPKGDIRITKKDGTKVLKGAKFGLYSDASCTSKITERTSDEGGNISFVNLDPDTYYVKEIESPEGYKLDSTVYTFVLVKNGSVVETHEGSASNPVILNKDVNNTPAKGKLIVEKHDNKNNVIYTDDAKFELYDDALGTNRIATATTVSGIATFDNLELGKTYYYREVVAPTNYLVNNTIFSKVVGTGKEREDQTYTVSVINEPEIGSIVITKQDDSAIPVKLGGITFKLYESNGTTPVNKPGTSTHYTVTTDDSGKAVFEKLPIRTYVIKEDSSGLSASYDIGTNGTPGVTVVVKAGANNVTVVNKRKLISIEFTKTDGTNPLKDAEFDLLDKSTLARVDSGITGIDGKLTFKNVPYGEYIIRETKAPDGYNKAADVEVTTTHFNDAYNTASKIHNAGTIVDKKQNGRIKLIKKKSNGELLKDAVFTLYDSNGLKVKDATSDASGEVLFTELKYGTYTIQETSAPTDYILDTKEFTVKVEDDTPVVKDVSSVDLIATNTPVVNPIISLKLKKTDKATIPNAVEGAVFGIYRNSETKPIREAVSDASGIVLFQRVNLADDPDNPGTDRTIDADNDIFYIKEISAPVGYKKSNSDIVLGTANELQSAFSGAYLDNVPATPKDVTNIIYYNNSEADATVQNEQIFGSVEVTKKASGTGALLAGAEFELLKADKTSFSPKKIATTDGTGKVTFAGLPVGYYYVRETKAPQGYALSAIDVNVEILNETPVTKTVYDTPLELHIVKRATGDTINLTGAEFELREFEGGSTEIGKIESDYIKVIGDTYIVDRSKLKAGSTYKLFEKTAPVGYKKLSTSTTFKIETNGDITFVSGENGLNAVQDANNIIIYDDPIKVSFKKIDDSSSPGPYAVSNAVMALYDSSNTEIYRFTTTSDEIEIPVGVITAPVAPSTKNEYTLKEIVTPAGYETAAPFEFYVTQNGGVYRKSDTSIITTTVEIEDKKIDTSAFYVRKIDSETSENIAGAEMVIYATDDVSKIPIVSWTSDGSNKKIDFATYTTFVKNGSTRYTLKEVNTPEGYLVADEIIFTIDASSKLTVVNGVADAVNGDKDTLLMRDKSYKIGVRKVDSFGSYLPGATLKISEYTGGAAGTTIETVNSIDGVVQLDVRKYSTCDTTAAVIDKAYILEETIVPAGYIKADPVVFAIDERTGKLVTIKNGVKTTLPTQNITMVDAEAGISIGKVDADTKNLLPADLQAKFRITCDTDVTFINKEWTSDGTRKNFELTDFKIGHTYKLSEIEAPKGYAYAPDIEFTIDPLTHEVKVSGLAMPNRTIDMADNTLKVYISKIDMTNDAELPGATIRIERKKTDGSYELVEEFVSGDTKHLIPREKLIAPATTADNKYTEYKLTEITAPYGYAMAETVYFGLDSFGKVHEGTVVSVGNITYDPNPLDANTVTMKDAPLFNFSKKNLTGDEIPGAKITISAPGDASIEPFSFVSTDKPTYFNVYRRVGGLEYPVLVSSSAATSAEHRLYTEVEYTFTETNAPKGYAYAEDMTFKITEEDGDVKIYVNGKLIDPKNPQAVMVDDAIGVYISKKDITNDDELPGAKIVIKDEAGNEIYTFTSGTTEHKIPSEVFTAPAPGTKFTYYSLTELTAPKGYEVAETMYFALDKSGLVYVKDKNGEYVLINDSIITMYDEPTEEKPPVKPPVTPPAGVTPPDTSSSVISKTPSMGDTAPIKMVVVLEIVSLIGLALCFVLYRRRKED